jgi:cytochrome c-type biogenesis protein
MFGFVSGVSFGNMGIAFVGGLLSFLSPCVLPLVPGYISLISGVSIDRLKGEGETKSAARMAVIGNSLAFNAGLSVVFLVLGAAAGFAGQAVLNNIWIRIIGGIVIIAFGFQLMGVLKIRTLYKDTRLFGQQKPRGVFGSITLGMAFAAGWTPCIGPILGGIIGLAATSGGWRSGLILSAFYSAGLAVPFLVTGLGINQFLGFYQKFRRHLHKVEVVSGVMLILIGLLVASGKTTVLNSQTLAAWIPNLEGKLKFKDGSAQNGPRPGDLGPIPDATFNSTDGRPLKISDYKGQVVLLNFWATWCLPCRAEIPMFNTMQKDYEARGFKVVGVLSYDPDGDLAKFDIKQDYTILRGADNEVAKYDVPRALPTTIIIDRDGHMRKKFVGANEREAFDAVVKPLLDETAATASR